MAILVVNKNGKEWTKEAIKNLLKSNSKAVIKAITILYSYQTEEEKEIEATTLVNHKGFNKVDAEILTSFAEQIKAGRTLSQKQLALAFKLVPKYAGQILKHMAEQEKHEQEEELREKAQNALMKMNFAVWATQEGGKCGSELEYLYTQVDYNNCHANADVTEVTAELTVHAWNGTRRDFDIVYKQTPDKISGEDLRNYIRNIDSSIDFETVVNGYDLYTGKIKRLEEIEYDKACQEPEKWEEYSREFECI